MYTIEAGDNGAATIRWLGPSPWTANELLAAAARASGRGPKRDQVREFLARALEAGARTSREIWSLAQEQGLSRRTLRRAKLDLGIGSIRVWVDGKQLSYWLLPGQELPASVPAEAVPPSLEEWLAIEVKTNEELLRAYRSGHERPLPRRSKR